MRAMSAGASTEYSFSQESKDKPSLALTSTTNCKLTLDGVTPTTTSDVSNQKYEVKNLPAAPSGSSLTVKTQVLPFVYIPNNTKPNNNVNNVFVINNTATTTPVNLSLNQQNVILARPQSLLLQKPQTATAAYLTMIKPIGNEFPILNNNTYVQSQNNNNNNNKIVIAPMPKLTTNRPPATATTDSVQPKIALLPMPVPNAEQALTKYNVYQDLPKDDDCSIVDRPGLSNESSVDSLVCDEVIELDDDDEDVVDKTYELSITEDPPIMRSSPIISNHLKFKPGVSILKKPLEGGKENVLNDSIIITIPPQKNEKENRRKSTFSYRKEFDDEVLTSVASDPIGERGHRRKSSICYRKEFDDDDDPTKKLGSEIEIELIKEKPKNDLDIQKVLTWDDGIGTLPGSTLKFIMNEFNILEYISEEEYKSIVERRMAKAKEKMKSEMGEEQRCLECGCYGLPSEFISPKYCSFDCKETNLSKPKKDIKQPDKFKKKKRRRDEPPAASVKLEEVEEETVASVADEEDSNDNSSSQDKYIGQPSRPWACKKKGFSWSKYLEHIKAKAAPVKLFKDPFPYNRNGFRPGMKLEGVDRQHPSYFCVFTVAEVVGYRLRLHFDGYPDNYDFWRNADSMDIFPMGWCEKHNHILQPPAGHTVENFSWSQYLKITRSTAAPKHLFANRAGQAICPNGFRIGMKLEAVDRKNTSLVCVASIRDMMDNRILVHFDSWDDIYDYWADPTSPYIHPVGWCDQYGHNLTPPNDYPNPESFSWEKYLKETKAVAAPVRAFKQRPACGFKRGMRLECVDRRVPQLIRVATVDDVKEHQIRIHFDGWLDRYSYWVDDDSPDIHPVGWCQKTGHPLEPPLTPDDVYDFMDCRTVGCKGLGHVKGPRYPSHTSPKHCPYAEENVDQEKVLPDRLLSPDRSPEEVVPVSREPKECKIKPRVGRPPKYLKAEPPRASEPPGKRPRRPETVRPPAPSRPERRDKASQERRARLIIERSEAQPAERLSWQRHARFLKRYTATCDDPRYWSHQDVSDFVSSIECCRRYGDLFSYHRIDGEAFLSLSQRDLVAILKIKVGPAVKLYNGIVLLRQRVRSDDTCS